MDRGVGEEKYGDNGRIACCFGHGKQESSVFVGQNEKKSRTESCSWQVGRSNEQDVRRG
jgi:hypothetical protein